MKVWVDGSTVTVKLEWSEPTAARDIVDAAVKNFLDARLQAEVGVIPARLQLQEKFVQDAHKGLEIAAGYLAALQKAERPEREGEDRRFRSSRRCVLPSRRRGPTPCSPRS